MYRKRLSSIVEESEPRDSGSSSGSLFAELLPANLNERQKSASSPVESRGRQRSSSLGRFFRMAFCGGCRAPPKNFSNTSLEIPPFRGETRAVKTERRVSSPERLVRAAGQMAGILIADGLMRATPNPNYESGDSETLLCSEKAESRSSYERVSRSNFPRPSTGAVPKIRARSVPPRLQECKNCVSFCEYGGIIVDESLFPQQGMKSENEDIHADFSDLIARLPTPLFERGACPACCSECRAVAAGVPVDESTRTCCCGFEKARCLLPDIPIPPPATSV